MAIVVSGISLPFTEPEEEALRQAAKILGIPQDKRFSLYKKSIDARKQRDIRFVYSVAVELEGGEEALVQRLQNPKISLKRQEPLQLSFGKDTLKSPPVIAGFGPAGMFAGLLLARNGYRPLILERGADMDNRVQKVEDFWKSGLLDPETNVQFGEGGAGTFSDGKLTTRIGDSRCRFILEELCRHGAPEEILYQAKPHVGTDLLRGIVKGIREEIIRLGGKVCFNRSLIGLELSETGLRAVATPDGPVSAGALILAPGNSARELFAMLADQGVDLAAKPFSVGVRIEHLQGEVDKALYGDFAGHPLLPKGEYQLSHRRGNRAVYTFCMCPGGVVVPAASEQGGVVTNGMSYHARDGINANAALAVSVDPADFGGGALDGVAFQRNLEQAAFALGGGTFQAPAQTVGAFLTGKSGGEKVAPTYTIGIKYSELSKILPDFVAQMMKEGLVRFGKKLPGFDAPGALLTGVETRTSSPVRILRGEDMEAVGVGGLYPCGEGAGYAGGIISAAVDGVRAAQALMARFAPPQSAS